MIERIENRLNNINSHHLIDQYDIMVKVVEDTKFLLVQNKNESNLALLKRVLDKIHELRFKLAYNKGTTDLGELDVNLKKSWESLNALLPNSD
ncbi:hypothetical protein L21SP5_00261 [Salinivirga cyanobacteriivorans]|uniref:Uncharacterized protein n=1 Tax=Salinivirga cyanobacteriivorans TaxID=1307839 RepID=A0A0S2HVB6_9BACT|nr:hypothetical protein [Salinivirga cyanobacteriivorans]ALO13941.1 hypothetical protein L21SP5_00261 [Salinivirga cyanobacteriivorans]